jgi:flagellin-specific chaperone FliS
MSKKWWGRRYLSLEDQFDEKRHDNHRKGTELHKARLQLEGINANSPQHLLGELIIKIADQLYDISYMNLVSDEIEDRHKVIAQLEEVATLVRHAWDKSTEEEEEEEEKAEAVPPKKKKKIGKKGVTSNEE